MLLLLFLIDIILGTLHAKTQQCIQHLKLVLRRPALSVIALVQQKQTAQSDKDVNPVRKAGKRFT